MKKFSIKDYITMGMFAALTAVLSQISIPLPFTPVPLNLAMLSPYVAGGLLGAAKGALSQVIYVLLGAAGLPVFANFGGGIGVLAGPTGGYLIGYIAEAFIVGAMSAKGARTVKVSKMTGASGTNRTTIFAMIVGTLVCYALGTIGYITISKTPLFAALSMCVFPFLPGDALKITAAALILKRMNSAFALGTQ